MIQNFKKKKSRELTSVNILHIVSSELVDQLTKSRYKSDELNNGSLC